MSIFVQTSMSTGGSNVLGEEDVFFSSFAYSLFLPSLHKIESWDTRQEVEIAGCSFGMIG